MSTTADLERDAAELVSRLDDRQIDVTAATALSQFVRGAATVEKVRRDRRKKSAA